MAQGSYLCMKCKNKVRLDDIRYDSNGRDLICEDCYSKKIKKRDSILTEKPAIEHNESGNDKGRKIKVICTDCRYKFAIRIGSNVSLRCPYCGRNRLVKDETSVDQLIREVSEKGEVY